MKKLLCTIKKVVSAALSSRATGQTSGHLERNQTSCKHEFFHPTLPTPLQNCIAVKDLQLIIAAGMNLASSSGGSSRRESLLGQNKGLMLSALCFHAEANSAGQHIFPSPFSPLPQRDDLWKDAPATLSKSPHEPFQQISNFFFNSADWLPSSFCPPSLPKNEPSGKRMAPREKAKHNNNRDHIDKQCCWDYFINVIQKLITPLKVLNYFV